MENLSAAQGACQHCGDPSPPGDSFCCRGCESVFTLLQSRGLGHFYELRKQYSFARPKLSERPLEQDIAAGARSRFYIEGIHCLGCLWLLEKLPEIDSRVRSAKLDLAHNILTIEIDPGISWNEVAALISQLGYSARAFADEDLSEAKREDQHRQLIRLGIAGFSAGNVMLLAVALYAGAADEWAPIFRWLSAALAAPALTYSAWPLYRSAILPLRHRKVSVDLAITLAIVAGIALSLRALLLGSDEIYFDSLSMLVFLLLSSRYLLARYRESLSRESPFLSFFGRERYARLKPIPGILPAKDLKVGDVILLKRGQTLPADSRILTEAHFDLSLMTGESMPVKALERELIESGARLLSDSASCELHLVAADSRLSRILQQIKAFQLSRTPSLDLAERMGSYFVLVVLSIASLVLFTFPNEEGMRRALALVIVTCPCVLAFAVPLALSRSLQRAARAGILFRNTDKIESLAAVETVFLDKTGTLTNGLYELKRWDTILGSEKEARAVALALESRSNHPIARAIARHTAGSEPLQVTETEEIPGAGIRGRIGRDLWEIRKAKQEPAAGENEVRLYRNSELQARITLGDQLRLESEGVVKELQKMGLRIVLVSGDSEPNVAATANHLGITEWHSRMLPEQKAAILEGSSNSAMVGDGANDAIAFQAAEIGIAVQGAMDLSLKNCDLALTRSGLHSLVPAIRLARSTVNLIRLNFAVTLSYNLVAGALAIGGFMSPLLAAILMPSSALSVFAFTQWRSRGGVA